MKYIILLAALFAALPACSSVYHTYKVHSRIIEPLAEQAAQVWCDATDGRYCPVIATDGEVAARPIMIQRGEWCGWHTDAGISINYDAVLSDECRHYVPAPPDTLASECVHGPDGECWVWVGHDIDVVAILVHELGHAAGLRDVRDRCDTIMATGCSWRPIIPTDEDVRGAVR